MRGCLMASLASGSQSSFAVVRNTLEVIKTHRGKYGKLL
jgi:hypothetical protein